jgi:hypothetical protein
LYGFFCSHSYRPSPNIQGFRKHLADDLAAISVYLWPIRSYSASFLWRARVDRCGQCGVLSSRTKISGPHILPLGTMAPQSSYPPFDSSVLGALSRESPLHLILAIVLAFNKPPSSLQIGHVLDLPWTEIRESLLPVVEFLDPPGLPECYYSNIHLSGQLRDLLINPSRPQTFVDLPKWHACLASWCLIRSRMNYDAR